MLILCVYMHVQFGLLTGSPGGLTGLGDPFGSAGRGVPGGC